ncbi:nucleoside deaminase [Halobacteriales archaeon QH_6_64_20]|jgi:cytosine/adenosine deaminase-related metal-dependent hydrolase|nr:MAG: nucleoside deaminase [Halobacteriales archaeon QH_6_64_20]
MEIEGTVIAGRAFEPIEGRVVVENGEITAVEEASVDSSAIVLPAFVNAHTHIGDSLAKEAGAGLSLDELVAPPDGLKHRLLRAASREELVDAMDRTVSFMSQGGTSAFVEFREGGVTGVRAIEEALTGSSLDAVVLGRESIEAMYEADGYGASGANDGDFERERAATREAEKLFAIHAGERDTSDIDAALALDPDLLVHMVHAEPTHVERVAERETPVAVCPRSNLVTGVGLGPVEALVERTTVALGTDNVMLNNPSMFREMEFAAKLFDLPAGKVLEMATLAGAEIAGLDRGVIEEGAEAKLCVLDGDSPNLAGAQDVVRAVVRRAGVSDIERIVY